MSGSFNDKGQLEISDGRLIFLTGKKKSGKSVLAKVIFQSYPGDRVILDIAGDDGPFGPDVIDIRGNWEELPTSWPEYMRKYTDRGEPLPMTLRYAPDAGSPTLLKDMDAVVGLAMAHSRKITAVEPGAPKDPSKLGVLLLIHEIGVLTPVNKTQPHMRRLLMHNRHNGITALMCGPRPKAIDVLVLAQSDVVFAFELPNKKDREKLAEGIDWNVSEWDDAMLALGPHECLRYDANEMKPEPGQPDMRVLHFPALPADVAAEADRPMPALDQRSRRTA